MSHFGDTYKRIYAIVRQIPIGNVATYGDVARLAGLPGQARLVGYALHALLPHSAVPWHRVINAKGEISVGARKGADLDQRVRLEAEGIEFMTGGRMALEQIRWRPHPPRPMGGDDGAAKTPEAGYNNLERHSRNSERWRLSTMTDLKTLRDVVGLGNEPASLSDAALIMIDCQNTYREGVLRLTGVEEAIIEAQRLLSMARDMKTPIIHIQHDAGTGSPYDTSTELGAISADVAPRAGEPVIVKNYPNAFFQTELEARLKALGIEKLILAGFMTHMCVNSTARGAFNLGFAPTIVARATATRPLPGPAGESVSAQAMQVAALAAVKDLFAVVVNSADDLRR